MLWKVMILIKINFDIKKYENYKNKENDEVNSQ